MLKVPGFSATTYRIPYPLFRRYKQTTMGQDVTNSALVAIDLLEDHFNEELWPDSQIPGQRDRLAQVTNSAVSAFRRANLPVIWIRQEFEPDLSDAYPHMVRRGTRYTIKNTPGAQLLHELDHRPSDKLLIKKRFSAFFNTELETVLADLNIMTVYLLGITSSWCLRSTAVDAYQIGFDVVLIPDGVSGFNQATHEVAMSEMNGTIATEISAAELLKLIEVKSVSIP